MLDANQDAQERVNPLLLHFLSFFQHAYEIYSDVFELFAHRAIEAALAAEACRMSDESD